MKMWKFLLLALLVRLILLLYGEWQDRHALVKYTDVDYLVFSDAAAFVLEGSSPYNRSTYRYTPLLAWMLTPNFYIGNAFGKILFIAFDIATGLLIYDILIIRGHTPELARKCCAWWLFNILPIIVSSRGNAESIMSVLVLLTLKFLLSKSTKTMSFLFGLSVHLKIYPLTYSMPIYFLLSRQYSSPSQTVPVTRPEKIKYFLIPNKDRLTFVLITGGLIVCLSTMFYHMYGWAFLEHSYFYHLKRRDIRHNFSVYFYMLYLIDESVWSGLAGLAVFLPQCFLMVAISVKFYKDPPFCFFLQTFLFVTFNKVCTSQYFLWYWCLVPLILPELKMKTLHGWSLILLWLAGQGVWLLPAYYLEIAGRNTFIYIWLAGLSFFLVNLYIMKELTDAYHFSNWYATKGYHTSPRFTKLNSKLTAFRAKQVF